MEYAPTEKTLRLMAETNAAVRSRGVPAPARKRAQRVPARKPMALAVGATVRAADRLNYGRVTEILGNRVSVRFVNPETQATAEVEFLRGHLTVVRPARGR